MITIAHIVSRDKFTSGYVNFMKQRMREFEHVFIILKEGFPLSLANEENVYYINDFSKIKKEKEILGVLGFCDFVIATGIFDSIKMLIRLPLHILKKTFLHFWGGDFYIFVEKKSLIHIGWQKMKYEKMWCFKHCAGFIFLIDGEYEKFKELVGIEKQHYIAPMPFDPNRNFKITDYRTGKRNKDIIKIMIGNSATETNQHMEIIDWLSRYTDKNMKVYAPLSYGDDIYKNEVIAYGKKKLGDLFFPIEDYMDEESYTKFIASIDIGIFNNNRQQAMGNIQMLLALGKKVYIREDTSMWERYVNDGYIIFPIKNTELIDYQEFIEFEQEMAVKNEWIYDDKENEEKYKKMWELVFYQAEGDR